MQPHDTHPTAAESVESAQGQSAATIQAIATKMPVPAIAPVQVAPKVPAESRSSALEIAPGTPLWHYWTTGAGTARWLPDPAPWTALHDALISEGVPTGQAQGLATNIMMATPEGRAAFAAHHQGGHGG
jgi:hypothetical protein